MLKHTQGSYSPSQTLVLSETGAKIDRLASEARQRDDAGFAFALTAVAMMLLTPLLVTLPYSHLSISALFGGLWLVGWIVVYLIVRRISARRG